MAEAKRDGNHVTSILGVSSSDPNITIPAQINPVTGRLKVEVSGAGTGDVNGPASSTTNAITRYADPSGKVIKNGVVTESDSGILQKIESADYSLTPVNKTHVGGRQRWNSNEHTFDLDMDLGDVNIAAGQTNVIIFLNNTGATIPLGKAVIPIGSIGSKIIVKLALADNSNNISGSIFVTAMEVLDGEEGIMVRFGKVKGFDTSSFTAGQSLYVSDTTPGDLVNTAPQFPSYPIIVGGAIDSQINGVMGVDVIGTPQDTVLNFWNGSIRESFDFLITSDGATITGSLTESNSGDFLTLLFVDSLTVLDVSTPVTITLTPGPDNNPTKNYVFIPFSTKVLTVNTSGFPAEQHIRVADPILQTASTTQTNGALQNRNWNDHIEDSIGQGENSHIGWWIRSRPAGWESGAEGTITINTNAGTLDDVYFSNTSGKVWQKHLNTFVANDMAIGKPMYIPNDFTTPYRTTTNLDTELTDALGASMSGRYFNFVVWGIQNKNGEIDQIMMNLPTGSYTTSGGTALQDAINDVDDFNVFSIPNIFNGTGFLIAKYTFKHAVAGNGTWTLENTVDLRGQIPSNVAGGGVGGAGVTEYTSLTDVYNSYIGQSLKLNRVNVGETAIETVAIADIAIDKTTPQTAAGKKTFSDGIIAPTTINEQTGTTYTLVLTDQNVSILANNAAAQAYTIPLNASVAFPIGTTMIVTQYGVGIPTITGDTGVTVNGVSAGGVATVNQYDTLALEKIDTDEWLILGGASGGGGASEFMIVEDQKAVSTGAGNNTATSTWQTRTLNTITVNDITGASLSSNEVTLPAGDYLVRFEMPGYDCDFQGRLYNVTDASEVVLGTSGVSDSSDPSNVLSTGEMKFTIAGEKDFRIEMITDSTVTDNRGRWTGLVSEVYTRITIQKLA